MVDVKAIIERVEARDYHGAYALYLDHPEPSADILVAMGHHAGVLRLGIRLINQRGRTWRVHAKAEKAQDRLLSHHKRLARLEEALKAAEKALAESVIEQP